MNCLTHLLELFDQGHRFVLMTNEDHFVGVNDKKIFELDDKYSQILDDYGTYIVSSDTYYQK